jgi:SAM-dependent methyltransferase
MSQATTPTIFDRRLLRLRLSRALRTGPADFLLQRVVEDLDERLGSVLRQFDDVLDLGTPTSLLVERLALRHPKRLIHAALVRDALTEGTWLNLIADEEALPFAPESFDLITSALSLQNVNDLPGALVQIRRALRPDGLFMGCFMGGQSLHELRAVLAEAEEEIMGGVSPRVAPFVDLRDLGALLQRAGFALPVTDVDTLTVRYDHLFALAHDLRAMAATNILALRDRRGISKTVLLRAAEIYQQKFSDSDGRIRATFDLVWLSGWSPHESQQKPLQPGSAKMRLADALKTKEGKLPG